MLKTSFSNGSCQIRRFAPTRPLTGRYPPAITTSVLPRLLRTSRHHRLHLNSGSPLTKNLSLWCWDLRSCHLNCQSLWMCLICRGGLPSTGGWDTNTKSHASTRSTSGTHRGHHINVCAVHEPLTSRRAHCQTHRWKTRNVQ